MFNYIQILRSNDSTGKMNSNVIGWHSQNFNLKDSEPKFFINSISLMINESLTDMGWDLKKNELKVTGMWTIINPPKASNSRHIHSNNFISAAYYLKAPEKCGNILFYDPRSARIIRRPITNFSNKLNEEVVNITPQEGLLVLFPSYLHHSVAKNNSDEERIVISYNIVVVY